MNPKELETLEQLRLQRDFKTALSLLKDGLRRYPQSGAVLQEAIKISLLAHKNQQAHKFFQHLCGLPDATRWFEAEYLLRLHLSVQGMEMQECEQLQPKSNAKWCDTYRFRGVDPLYKATITLAGFECKMGPINYDFTLRCASCDVCHRLQVQRTLLIRREFLCPGCFARQFIDYSIIKHFLTNALAKIPADELRKADEKIHQLQNQFNIGATSDPRLPLICRYLNQDYIFMLNEVLLKRWLNNKTR
ncbi:MAG: hypothetical protein ACE5IR_12385 [bacterium]